MKLSESMWQKHSVFYVSLLKLALTKVLILTQVLYNYLIKQEE